MRIALPETVLDGPMAQPFEATGVMPESLLFAFDACRFEFVHERLNQRIALSSFHFRGSEF